MAISDAVGLELISRVVGYKLTKGDYANTTPNLPQRGGILVEGNDANQSTFNTTPYRITSAQQAGDLFGYGSPAYHIARILFPISGGGTIGGIPIYFFGQKTALGATTAKKTITVSGTATAGGTHYVVVAGRYSIDGGSYAVNIAAGDTATQIAVKIYNVINNVLGSPVTASQTSPTGAVTTLETKWSGATANFSLRMDTGSSDLGISYAIASTQSGVGTPTVSSSLAQFGNEWYTGVLNSYGFVQDVIDELQAFNGIPDPNTPTGRYAATIFKPFGAYTGTTLNTSTSSADTLICDAESTEVTIWGCPAPLSEAFQFEAAANYMALNMRIAQDTPQLDIEGKYLPDMPVPVLTTQIAMKDYSVRDAVVKMGMSTVDIVAGKFQVQDFVSTYHPTGEVPPQFRYARNLNLDWNVRYGYYLLEQINVVDHTIADDNTTVNAVQVIKPKQWKAIVKNYAVDLGQRGLIADVPFMQDSVTVGISVSNPDRLETFFRYKRTGVTRISSTTAEAGFNFGTV